MEIENIKPSMTPSKVWLVPWTDLAVITALHVRNRAASRNHLLVDVLPNNEIGATFGDDYVTPHASVSRNPSFGKVERV
jgi:hypothetical protein